MDAFTYFLEHTNNTFDILLGCINFSVVFILLPIFAIVLLILTPYLITYIIANSLYKHEQCQSNLKQE